MPRALLLTVSEHVVRPFGARQGVEVLDDRLVLRIASRLPGPREEPLQLACWQVEVELGEGRRTIWAGVYEPSPPNAVADAVALPRPGSVMTELNDWLPPPDLLRGPVC